MNEISIPEEQISHLEKLVRFPSIQLPSFLSMKRKVIFSSQMKFQGNTIQNLVESNFIFNQRIWISIMFGTLKLGWMVTKTNFSKVIALYV